MKIVTKQLKRGFPALAWCLCILLIACVAGCQKEAPTTDTNEPAPDTAAKVQAPAEGQPAAVEAPPAAPEPEPEPAVDPNLTVVSINGEDITEGQLGVAVESQVRRAGAQMQNLPPMFVEQFKKQMRQRVLDMLVSERLLDQQIAAANVVVTDEEVLSSMAEMGARQNPPMTVDQYKAAIEARGGTFDEAKQQYKRGLSRQKFMETQWVGKIDVNDADAQAYYEATPQEFTNEEKVQASHILVKLPAPEGDADPNLVKVAVRAKAEKLLGEVKDGGDFAEVAKANSDCPSAEKGGDLGLFGKGQMVKPFADAAFAMQPGEMSGIVETRFGYHIIKVTDRQAGSVTPFEEAKAGIVQRLTMQKKSQIAQAYLDTLKEKATIVYAEGNVPAPPAPAPMAPVVRPAPVAPVVRPAPVDANEN